MRFVPRLTEEDWENISQITGIPAWKSLKKLKDIWKYNAGAEALIVSTKKLSNQQTGISVEMTVKEQLAMLRGKVMGQLEFIKAIDKAWDERDKLIKRKENFKKKQEKKNALQK